MTEKSNVVSPFPSYFIEDQSTIVQSIPTPSAVVRPLVVQVYSRKRETNDTCPTTIHMPWDLTENHDLPIALRKGTHSCKSTYSIANYVSYDGLYSTSGSMIASLDSVYVPKIAKETLNHPRWSNAMLDEIHALDENHTWDWWINPRERNQWNVSGYSQLKLEQLDPSERYFSKPIHHM